MILNENKVEKAAENEVPLFPVGNEKYIAKNSFKAGVKFTESQLSELAIEFGDWLAENNRCGDRSNITDKLGFTQVNDDDEDWPQFTDFKTTKELFEEFLKTYNE